MPIKTFGVAIVALVLASMEVFAGEPDAKRYSYVCLESNQDLCLGISPGDADPVYDAANLNYLQVKSRSRNEEQALDYRKMRWDLSYGQGKISLSNFTSLCATKLAHLDKAALLPCNISFPRRFSLRINYGRWNLGPLRANPNGAGTMMLAGSSRLCLTVMKCKNSSDAEYCDPDSNEIAWNTATNSVEDLRRGSYLKFRTCYNRGGIPGTKNVQVWRQRLDCAKGCSPMLQDNDVCDASCNNAKCGWDNGHCVTTKQPTFTPTKKPVTLPPGATNAPVIVPTGTQSPTAPTTLSPTTRAPTPQPGTTRTPTASPTITCPASLEICNRQRTRRKCLRSPGSRQSCTWCLNGCRPRNEPRACTIIGFYEQCKPKCPTDTAASVCPKLKSRRACSRSKLGCTYCGTKGKCRVGRDARICADAAFYSYCAPSG